MRKLSLLLVLVFALASVNVFASTAPGTASDQAGVAAKLSEKININTADEAVLVSLPGIGPKTAAAIVSFRTEHGNFKTIQDLSLVKGIGEKKLKKIEPFLEKI